MFRHRDSLFLACICICSGLLLGLLDMLGVPRLHYVLRLCADVRVRAGVHAAVCGSRICIHSERILKECLELSGLRHRRRISDVGGAVERI